MTLEMLSNHLNQPAADIIRAADRHTLAVQSWLSSRAPEAVRYAGVGVKASSTGLRVPLLNLALGCDFPPGTPQRAVDDEIAVVKDFFAARGSLPWYWWIGPNPSPSDIRERLLPHGIIFDAPPLPAMVAPLPAGLHPADPAITVWQAATRADLDAASLIRRTAFRFPDGAAIDYFGAMTESWLAGDPARLYLARLGDDSAAAIGALIMAEGLPGVYVMATLPEYGRRGLGKAILARILADAEAEGHRMIVLTASRLGFPLYQQFGFIHAFDYAIYRPEAG